MRVHDKQYLRDTYQPALTGRMTRGKHPQPEKVLLGHGVFGEVSLAVDKRDNCQVAIKQQLAGPRASSELAIHATLDLPHVIRLRDVAKDGVRRYLIMELGQPIALDTMTVAEACDIMVQLIEAVASLHRRDIFHGDIKVKSLLRVDGVVKLYDFGEAVCSPGKTRRAYHVAVDVAGICHAFNELLTHCDPSAAAAFTTWYRTLDKLTLDALKRHPLLCRHYGVQPDPVHSNRHVMPWSWRNFYYGLHYMVPRRFTSVRLASAQPTVMTYREPVKPAAALKAPKNS